MHLCSGEGGGCWDQAKLLVLRSGALDYPIGIKILYLGFGMQKRGFSKSHSTLAVSTDASTPGQAEGVED